MDKYVCTICGYLYSPVIGDRSRSDVPKKTAFHALPEDWKCPQCGADKRRFESFEQKE
ncbi:MAG: rubredoxin [Thermodesulfobacteriota bacterium]